MEKLMVMVWVLAFGLVVGSFLNVCIYRFPRGEEVVRKPSHCPNCMSALKWYELIPVFSFLAQGGRCRNCKEKISIQYPAVELLNGVLYLWIVCKIGYQPISILYCLCTSALIVIAVIDFRTYEIPLGCNLFIGALGAARFFVSLADWQEYVIGFFAVSGLFLIIYLITKGKGIGGGDIKLMAAAGLLLGWKHILLALAVGSVAGAVIHIMLMKLKNKNRVLAFGPYLAAGIFIAMVYGDELIDWYLHFCGL